MHWRDEVRYYAYVSFVENYEGRSRSFDKSCNYVEGPVMDSDSVLFFRIIPFDFNTFLQSWNPRLECFRVACPWYGLKPNWKMALPNAVSDENLHLANIPFNLGKRNVPRNEF